jgi:DNA segregation ATPase FtsK/SpoIIIE-like protein
LKTERELLSSSHDLKKLEIISEINNKIDTNYDNSSDVVQISHKILLSKVKLNVKAGINKKVGSFNNAQNIFNNADLLLNKGLKTIISLSSDEIIEYINSKFDLSDLSMRLLPELTSKEEEKITSDKIINDYSTIISKYDLKKSIDFGSIDNLSNEDGEFTNVFNVSERDPLFEEAARMIVLHQQGSTSLIQRKLKLGYNRAGRIIDQLEAAHIVGPFDGSKAREVLITDEYSLDKFMSGLDT